MVLPSPQLPHLGTNIVIVFPSPHPNQPMEGAGTDPFTLPSKIECPSYSQHLDPWKLDIIWTSSGGGYMYANQITRIRSRVGTQSGTSRTVNVLNNFMKKCRCTAGSSNQSHLCTIIGGRVEDCGTIYKRDSRLPQTMASFQLSCLLHGQTAANRQDWRLTGKTETQWAHGHPLT